MIREQYVYEFNSRRLILTRAQALELLEDVKRDLRQGQPELELNIAGAEWVNLNDVPTNVIVQDVDKDLWRWNPKQKYWETKYEGSLEYQLHDGNPQDTYGPYKAVEFNTGD